MTTGDGLGSLDLEWFHECMTATIWTFAWLRRRPSLRRSQAMVPARIQPCGLTATVRKRGIILIGRAMGLLAEADSRP